MFVEQPLASPGSANYLNFKFDLTIGLPFINCHLNLVPRAFRSKRNLKNYICLEDDICAVKSHNLSILSTWSKHVKLSSMGTKGSKHPEMFGKRIMSSFKSLHS